MKIDLRRLKLHPRETEAFYLQSRGNDSFLKEIGGKFIAPVEVEIVVENTGTIFVGKGKIKTLLQLPCSRCLQDFTYNLESEVEVSMAENINSHRFNADEGFVFFDGDEADIGSIIDEAIFMAIPICPICQENCRGLCPVCGQDKNTTNCSCQEETIDPRWEKLKNLK
jgi:uncharacterized protein